MEGRRRRAQRPQQLPEAEMLGEQEQTQLPKQEEPAAQMTLPQQDSDGAEHQAEPPRRRRAQPPRQITQRMPRVSMPQDKEIPRLPAIEETPEPVKRYKKSDKKPGHKQMPTPKIDKEKLGKVADAAADTGKAMLTGLGGVLLLAVMTAGEGLGKLSKAIQNRQSRPASGTEEKPEAPGKAEPFELEAIRPQDYHGRGRTHSQAAQPQHAHDSGRAKHKAVNTSRIATIFFACVALVSLYQIGSIVMRSVRTSRLNDELAQRRAQLSSAQGDEAAIDEENFVVFGEEQADVPAETPLPAAEPTVQPLTTDVPVQAQQPRATDAPDAVKTMKYHQVGGDALPEMAALHEENRDLVAWMEIPDVLDLPVVYRDNSYYLTRDFYKQKNASGTIFLDENHPFREKTQNLLLHGHNMKDGTMFGRLAQYLHDNTYIKNHPFIYFNTLWKKEQYVIFAILDVSLDVKSERFFNYFTHDTFASDAEFTSYIRQLQLRSVYAIPVDVQPSDALLTLSTCLDEDRLVIVARRLRSGEARSDLRPMMQTVRRQ